ncbi:hypothetical protein ABTN13_20620, partial [Acinetobacter baumannii]
TARGEIAQLKADASWDEAEKERFLGMISVKDEELRTLARTINPLSAEIQSTTAALERARAFARAMAAGIEQYQGKREAALE